MVKESDFLRLAVFEDREVRFGQIGNMGAFVVGDDGGNENDFAADGDARLLRRLRCC